MTLYNTDFSFIAINVLIGIFTVHQIYWLHNFCHSLANVLC